MALDGAFLRCLTTELADALTDARVDKIHQPSREELIFFMRGRGGTSKLYLSARVQSPRVHITRFVPDNPATPPMFCMLMRKHLSGARLTAVRQDGLERALYLDFQSRNELGDEVTLTVACELMGRNSNLILIGADGKVLDAVRRVDFETSPTRPILPGVAYEPPPRMADKLDLWLTEPDALSAAVRRLRETPLCDALLTVSRGLSPLLCREAAFVAAGDEQTLTSDLSEEAWARLTGYLSRLRGLLASSDYTPYLLYKKDGTPFEFSFLPITQYGLDATGRQAGSLSELLDDYYAEKDEKERLYQRARDLWRVLQTAQSRLARKLDKQRQELDRSGKREEKRLFGDLLNANLHAVPRGADHADVINYYEPDCPTVRIPLDPAISAAGNAQRYYKEYRKAQTAERVLAEQIAAGEEEQQYLDTVSDALSRAGSLREIAELREELASGGYLRLARGKQKAPAALPPMAFRSSDGFDILVGRNNRQNDQLTLKTARGGDIWLHTKNIPGSHVIVVTGGKAPTDTALSEAAMLAAVHSKASGGAQVPVDFTEARHVRKPAGAKPGRVIYDHQQTLYVTPDKAVCEKLRVP